MRRTLAILAVAVFSLAAAAFAALRGKLLEPRPADPTQQQASIGRAGPLQFSAQLDRAFVSASRGGEAYLEVVVSAEGKGEEGPRVPVNAVLVLDRSGSMTGEKLARAKDAARELLARLNGDDRFALIDFGSDARVRLKAATSRSTSCSAPCMRSSPVPPTRLAWPRKRKARLVEAWRSKSAEERSSM